VAGQLVVLYFVLKVVMAADYSTPALNAGDDFTLHMDALPRFAVFGVLAVIGAYLASLCRAVNGAVEHHARIAESTSRAWLIGRGVDPTPANIKETIKQRADEIERAADAAMAVDGYPAGFWRKHQAMLSTPAYALLFFAASIFAWFVGGLGWSLMLPVDIALGRNRGRYTAPVQAAQPQKQTDGHTLG
jgi:hypothetical protein